MPKAKVNGKDIEFEAGLTVLQVAELAGEEIPRFCYHERLSIAGNCRMCLVEVKPGPPKPQASCALPAADNQEIFTNSPMVKKAREGVMEFLLINHPLDCPICDQGGECDLQDEALGYGRDGSRFRENKRAVEEKAMGPLIKTVMTRCIQCTRCVRFITEIGGVPEIGMIGRGEDAEITTYLEKAVASELSGNLVDVCPVGALTSKPYAFNARPWELTKTESVDVMDALGSAIRVDARGEEVLRVLPRLNEAINEEWISDKTRHACDGLSRQRLDRPYVRLGGTLREANWAQALGEAAGRLKGAAPSRIGLVAGDLQDAESMKAALDLFSALGVRNLDCRQDSSAHHPRFGRESYLFNATIAGIEAADAIVLIGAYPRKEAALLNARIRKRWASGPVRIGFIGERAELTYPYDHLGEGADAIARLSDWEGLRGAERPVFVIGPGAASGPDGLSVLAAAGAAAKACGAVRSGWNGWGALHAAASRVAGLDLGLVPAIGALDARAMTAKGALDVLVLLGADEIALSDTDAFVIYIGSHGDRGASRADVILPGAAYTEKSGVYVNTEGRVQLGARAVFPKGEAREDWAILRALAGRMDIALGYDSLEALRARLMRDHPSFGQVDYVAGPEGGAPFDPTVFGSPGPLSDTPLKSPVEDFYMTNPIARASVVMAQCSALHARPAAAALAAE